MSAMKFVFDFLTALVLLALLSPFMLVIAIAIKIANPRVPVFVGCDGLGKNRKFFLVWKFSTMVPNAKEVLEGILAANPVLRNEWETTFKLKNDPRILPGIGHFLRRTSLNELPQLFNVLCGEMSLVGPRPINAREEPLYLKYSGENLLWQRYSVRPGVTGLWQVEGRSDVSYEERVRLDHKYLSNKKFSSDLLIIFRTVSIVLWPKGAY